MHKVAAATNGKETISGHLGETTVFSLYEVNEDGSYAFIKEIPVLPPEENDKNVSHGAAQNIVSALKGGADTVLTAQAGPGAIRLLAQEGIRVYTISGNIAEILKTYGKKIPLIDRVHNDCGGCGRDPLRCRL